MDWLLLYRSAHIHIPSPRCQHPTRSLMFTANGKRDVLVSFRWITHTCHHSSVSFVCTLVCWTHDWLANKRWRSLSWNPGGLSIKPSCALRNLQSHQRGHQRLFRTGTSTDQRWVESRRRPFPACLKQVEEREEKRGLHENAVLHRAPTWCWKPGLSFWRARWSFVRCTSRRQLHPGTLATASFLHEKLSLRLVTFIKSAFSEPVKSPCQMESHYRAMRHRGSSTPSRSFCRCLQMNKTTRQPTETGTVWL